jgi:hypothetical protein
MLPELGGARRQEQLGHMHDLADEGFGFRAEGQLKAAGRAEEIGDDRVTTALNALEEQGRAAALNDATMNFGQFEIRINLRLDSDEIVLAREQV